MANMRFSQRIGKTPTTKTIQIESIDDDLKNGLWNVYRVYILDMIENKFPDDREKKAFGNMLWHNFFKRNIDEVPSYFASIAVHIKLFYFSASTQWYEIYDLLEYSLKLAGDKPLNIKVKDFIEEANRVLETEFAAYRFVNNTISPITNTAEIESINTANKITKQFSALKGCNIHLTESLRMLSDKINPDYRNSIKESISAIESISKVMSGRNSDTLGGALTIVKDKIGLHPSLERGFKQLYGYTSDSDGIRHGLMSESTCDFDDAKYMLVSSSAFINYLIAKANKAGISFT